MFHYPEQFRLTNDNVPWFNSKAGEAGAFRINWKSNKQRISVFVIASDGRNSDDSGWEHVSVSHHLEIPRWSWMCRIKDYFWDEDDAVMQYHAPKSEWINNHPRCLHLWRPIGIAIPKPPAILVGVKDAPMPRV